MLANSTDTPLSLLERIKSGDQDAWAEFVRKYIRVLENWCWKWKVQHADCQDVIQDTLLAVALGVPQFERRSVGSFRAWMRTIAWRCWCDALKKAERRQDQTLLRTLHQSSLAYDELDSAFTTLAEEELLQSSIARIRARVELSSWEAFRLTALESRPAAEVAASLKMNVDAVYAARCRVQRMITQEIKRLDVE